MKLYKATYGIQVKRHDLRGKISIVVKEEETQLISAEDKIEATYMARDGEERRGKKLVEIKQIPNY